MRPRLADPPGLRTSDTGDRDGECNKGECVGSAIKPCGRQDLVFLWSSLPHLAGRLDTTTSARDLYQPDVG